MPLCPSSAVLSFFCSHTDTRRMYVLHACSLVSVPLPLHAKYNRAWMLQRWLERTPGLSDSYFNFWQKYKATVSRWLDDCYLEPALVCPIIHQAHICVLPWLIIGIFHIFTEARFKATAVSNRMIVHKRSVYQSGDCSLYSKTNQYIYSVIVIFIFICSKIITRRPASADRTARAANFRLDLEAT